MTTWAESGHIFACRGSLHGLHLKPHKKWKVGMGGTDCILHAFRVGAGKNLNGESENSEVLDSE